MLPGDSGTEVSVDLSPLCDNAAGSCTVTDCSAACRSETNCAAFAFNTALLQGTCNFFQNDHIDEGNANSAGSWFLYVEPTGLQRQGIDGSGTIASGGAFNECSDDVDLDGDDSDGDGFVCKCRAGYHWGSVAPVPNTVVGDANFVSCTGHIRCPS